MISDVALIATAKVGAAKEVVAAAVAAVAAEMEAVSLLNCIKQFERYSKSFVSVSCHIHNTVMSNAVFVDLIWFCYFELYELVQWAYMYIFQGWSVSADMSCGQCWPCDNGPKAEKTCLVDGHCVGCMKFEENGCRLHCYGRGGK